MTVPELYARFSEMPAALRDEPVLARFADVFGEQLAVAYKPSNCSTGHDAGNHFYLALVGPLSYYSYGLATRERVLADLTALLDRQAADPEGFVASLLPADTATAEIKGPDCA